MSPEYDVPHPYAERLKTFGIHLGAPRLDPELPFLRVPEEPYVFWADTVHCIEPPDKIRKLTETLGKEFITPLIERVTVDKSEVQSLVFHDVMVMLGHGIRVGTEEHEWVFQGTRRPVSDTVLAFNEVARDIDPSWRPVDILICCRDQRETHSRASVSFDFHRGNAVCVYPFSPATIKNHPRQALMMPGIGAWIAAQAAEWSALTWFRTWDMERNKFLLRSRSVPLWATTLVP